MLDVRMFTVGPVQENCFIVREKGAIERRDRRSRRRAGATARRDREPRHREARCDPAHPHPLRPRRRGGAGGPATGAPVYCPELETPVLADIMAFVPWEGIGPFESYDADQTVKRRREPRAGRPRNRRRSSRPATAPATSRTRSGARTRCSPATSCSRARSGASTFRAATGRRCCASIETLVEAHGPDRWCTPATWGSRRSAQERATNPFLRELASQLMRDPGSARHVRRAPGGRCAPRRRRVARAADHASRRVRPDRDARVRGDRAVRARRGGGDRHRPEGDVHLLRRRGRGRSRFAPRAPRRCAAPTSSTGCTSSRSR